MSKDLGIAHDFLNGVIDGVGPKSTLSQSNMIEKILIRFSLQDSNPVDTPNRRTIIKNIRRYLTLSRNHWMPHLRLHNIQTRHYLCCALSLTIRIYTHTCNLNAAKRILRYLKGTKQLGIILHKPINESISFVDEH